MFGRKKHESAQEIKGIIEEVKKEWTDLQKVQREQIEAFNQLQALTNARWEQIDTAFAENNKQLKRYSESIEDMLDEGKAQEALSNQYELKIKEDTEREKALLSLICQYHDILGIIEEKLTGADAQAGDGWAEQIALFRKILATEFKKCAIEEIGLRGETADYKYHEILDVTNTEEENLDSTVAHTYRAGLIYHGKVLKKAQVTAYRGRRNIDDNRN